MSCEESNNVAGLQSVIIIGTALAFYIKTVWIGKKSCPRLSLRLIGTGRDWHCARWALLKLRQSGFGEKFVLDWH